MFGLGQYTADFLQGTRDESQRLRGERRKIAESFARFKAENPEATYADFRMFVDNMTDGSNYLRQAVPGDEMLRNLDKQNEMNRVAAAQQRRNAAIMGSLQGTEMNKRLLAEARASGTRDPEAVIQDVAKRLNLTDPEAVEGLRRELMVMNPQAVWNQMDTEETEALLDKGLQRINAGLFFDPKEVDTLISPTLKGTPFEERLRGQFGSALEQHLAQKERALFSDGLKLVLELGPEATPDQVMGIVRQYYGKNAPQESLEPLAKNLWDRAQKERSFVETERNFTVQSREREIAIGARQSIESDKDIQDALIHAPENVMALVKERLKPFFPGKTDAELTAAASNLTGILRKSVGSRQAGDFARTQQQLPELFLKDQERNMEAVGRFVGKDTPPATKSAILTILSRGDYIPPQLVPQMIEAANGMEGASVQEIVNALDENFAGQIMNSDQRRSMIMDQIGSIEPQRGEDFLKAMRSDMDGAMARFNERISRAIDLPNRIDRRVALQKIEQEMQAWMSDRADMWRGANADRSWMRQDGRLSHAAFAREGSAYFREIANRVRQMGNNIAAGKALTANDGERAKPKPIAPPSGRATSAWN